MAQVAKKAGVSAWTGAWRLPTGKADHQRAVRAQRRRDRGRCAANSRRWDGVDWMTALQTLAVADVAVPNISRVRHPEMVLPSRCSAGVSRRV